MLFEEISSSALKPFGSYISVRKAKQMNLIPTNHSHIFDDDCRCGSERMVRIQDGTRSVTAVTCCDPRCPLKMKFQVSEVFDRFEYKGIGPETCGKVVDDVLSKKGSVTLFDVIVEGMRYSNLSGSAEYEFASALKKIEDSRVSFGKFLANLSYPFIGRKFDDIFKGISSISDFAGVATTEGGIVPFFANRGVRSIDTIFHFVFFLKEIEAITTHYQNSIVASSTNLLPICLTGHMETSHKKYSKSEYLYQCNLLAMNEDGSKTFDVVSVETVSKAAYVIVGPDSIARQTTKYKAALAREEALKDANLLAQEEKFWFTPDAFLHYLLKGEESIG